MLLVYAYSWQTKCDTTNNTLHFIIKFVLYIFGENLKILDSLEHVFRVDYFRIELTSTQSISQGANVRKLMWTNR